MPKGNQLSRAEIALRRFALQYPDSTEEYPWGHLAVKVKGKIFVTISTGKSDGRFLSLSMKLPVSGKFALALPFASPTAYGLGKSGWVTARFEPEDDVPVDMLREWIDESFRAVAPKKVLAKLESAEANGLRTWSGRGARK
jgi:predicted DNA-binding protein (MmcQ/YjbR family)